MLHLKRVVLITVAILIILSVTVTPAYAWSFKDMFHSSSADRDYTKKLTEIEEQIGELSSDPKLMEFINRNMWEQKVRVIVIHITEDDEVLESYYIYRRDKGYSANISSTDAEGLGNSWTFKPTIKQTQTALKILESESLSVRLVLKCLYLWISVEKEDVPPIDDIIKNSMWIEDFLPKWW